MTQRAHPAAATPVEAMQMQGSTRPPAVATRALVVMLLAPLAAAHSHHAASHSRVLHTSSRSGISSVRTSGPGRRMVWFVVTTSLASANFETRRGEYERGIRSLLNHTARLSVPHRVVIVENRGARRTFLDDFGVQVVYTQNWNSSVNKGINELRDVFECLQRVEAQDTDFVVKMTGRYKLDDESYFIKRVNELDPATTHAIVKFGSYDDSLHRRGFGPATPTADCITGLIGMQARYIMAMPVPNETHCVDPQTAQLVPAHLVPSAGYKTKWFFGLFETKLPYELWAAKIEHSWAAAAVAIPLKQVLVVRRYLGVWIAPGGNPWFFLVSVT